MFSKKLLSGAALTALTFAMTGVAHAQSTGSQVQEEETVVVTAGRARTVEGVLVAETVTKSRATITDEFIGRQAAGQTILQTANLIPGVNFTNNDAYGSAGGNLRIRGFDGNRISLTFDGVPLNDTGNYAIFSNQQLDPELIQRASVNMGTTDVDSPTASATGGTVNYVTRRPSDEFGVWLQGGVGDDNYRRVFGMVDTGEIAGLASGFISGSYTGYDKWKGPGEIDKRQFNARLFHDMEGGDFLSLAVHYNQNRNNFYRNINLATFLTNPGLENDIACVRLTPALGVVNNESNQNSVVTWDGATVNNTSCTNYHDTRINPSNTGNIRGAASFGITDNLRLTIDPSFQYVLANGGGFSTISERDDRLDLNTTNNANITNLQCAGGTFNTGVDLNGDADTCDTVMLYSPNTTNTRRYGLTTSLLWDLSDQHRLRLAYTADYGYHRQTGDMGFYDANGNPEDVFGGKDGYGRQVLGVAGAGNLRVRDRTSEAILNQFAIEYRGLFLNDDLMVNAGVRAPMFERHLDQLCYSQNGSSNVRCTAETPSATLANGNVQFASAVVTNGWVTPYEAELEFDDILPNLGVSYRLVGGHSIYASYAEGFSAPRTDNLYTVSRDAAAGSPIEFPNAEPETTQSYDLGYRYVGETVVAQFAGWFTNYENRIVNAFDEDLGFFVDRNVGAVELFGVDAQFGIEPTDWLMLYASASYAESELQDDVPLGATARLPTRGRALVETPEWQFGLRGEVDVFDGFTLGLQGKFVDDRFSTDVNDQVAPSYTVFDFDARLDLGFVGLEDSFLQFNVINLFDEEYLGGISSQTNALNIADIDPVTAGNQPRAGSQPTYALGAPRTAMLTVRTRF
jgi:iron complex outermembrane recepter protein